MSPIILEISEATAERLNKRAGESGYATVQDYLMALIDQDIRYK